MKRTKNMCSTNAAGPLLNLWNLLNKQRYSLVHIKIYYLGINLDKFDNSLRLVAQTEYKNILKISNYSRLCFYTHTVICLWSWKDIKDKKFQNSNPHAISQENRREKKPTTIGKQWLEAFSCSVRYKRKWFGRLMAASATNVVK